MMPISSPNCKFLATRPLALQVRAALRLVTPSTQRLSFSSSSPSRSVTPDPRPDATDSGPTPTPSPTSTPSSSHLHSHSHSLRSLRTKGVHLPWLFNQDPPRLATRDALIPVNQVRARDLPFPRNLAFPIARLACDYLAYKWTHALFLPGGEGIYSSEDEFVEGAREAVKPALEAALSFDAADAQSARSLSSMRSLFSRAFYDRVQEQYETLANIDRNLAVKLVIDKVHEDAYIRARFALAGDKNVLLAHPSSSTKAVSIGPLSMIARKKPRFGTGSHPSDSTSATTIFNTEHLVMPATPQDVAVQIHMDIAVTINGSITIRDSVAAQKDGGTLANTEKDTTVNGDPGAAGVILHEEFVDREVVVRFASVPIGVTEDDRDIQWLVWDVDYWMEAEMRDNEE
ncbi:hypothetical protein BCR44DRAFT_79219 [Catenaria anguillulae PL171]|uniref:Uncharacterized protein n=1 Tax=Catenaria anguillulae PL171 TaxID=765915 RepID=A0A1Y2HFX2_9FUNG|nr:hypothetical protein BCR44DRAFT_79219 [Catenaria anguillulae PL171]